MKTHYPIGYRSHFHVLLYLICPGTDSMARSHMLSGDDEWMHICFPAYLIDQRQAIPAKQYVPSFHS